MKSGQVLIMGHDSIICIFCGKQADIKNEENQTMVRCSHCKRKTDLNNYQEMFDKWIGDIRQDVDGI